MRLFEALLASAFSNALGIFALLALTQLIRHFGGIDWLPEIYGIEAAGLVAVCAAIKTAFDLMNEATYIPPRHPWDRH